MMIRTILSFVAYGVALAAFISWFFRARALRGDGSPADRDLKRRLTWLMVGGFAALVVAYVL